MIFTKVHSVTLIRIEKKLKLTGQDLNCGPPAPTTDALDCSTVMVALVLHFFVDPVSVLVHLSVTPTLHPGGCWPLLMLLLSDVMLSG